MRRVTLFVAPVLVSFLEVPAAQAGCPGGCSGRVAGPVARVFAGRAVVRQLTGPALTPVAPARGVRVSGCGTCSGGSCGAAAPVATPDRGVEYRQKTAGLEPGRYFRLDTAVTPPAVIYSPTPFPATAPACTGGKCPTAR